MNMLDDKENGRWNSYKQEDRLNPFKSVCEDFPDYQTTVNNYWNKRKFEEDKRRREEFETKKEKARKDTSAMYDSCKNRLHPGHMCNFWYAITGIVGTVYGSIRERQHNDKRYLETLFIPLHRFLRSAESDPIACRRLLKISLDFACLSPSESPKLEDAEMKRDATFDLYSDCEQRQRTFGAKLRQWDVAPSICDFWYKMTSVAWEDWDDEEEEEEEEEEEWEARKGSGKKLKKL